MPFETSGVVPNNTLIGVSNNTPDITRMMKFVEASGLDGGVITVNDHPGQNVLNSNASDEFSLVMAILFLLTFLGVLVYRCIKR